VSETAATPSDHRSHVKPIYLVDYPKIILLYPTFFVALVCGICSLFLSADSPWGVTLAAVFLWTFGVNLVVLAFDFPRTTSLTIFFLVMAFGLGAVLLFQSSPEILPFVQKIFGKLRPFANASFYFTMVSVLGAIYLGVLVTVGFDYWEVRPNELLHHHGFLSSLERYSAPNLRVTKEINDVFEYVLLRSGRLILHPSNEPRAFVLENVLFINKKEEQITQMLGSLSVRVRSDEG